MNSRTKTLMSCLMLVLAICAALAFGVLPAKAVGGDVSVQAVAVYPLVDTLPEVNTPAHTVWFGVGILNPGANDVNCNVTIYLNTVPKIIVTNYLVGANSYQTLVRSMTTSDIGKGTWVASAFVAVEGDQTPSDNTLTGDTLKIGMIADVNCDGKVDLKDLSMVAARFGMGNATLNPTWTPEVDYNLDGKIDIRDVAHYASLHDYYNATHCSVGYGSTGPHGSPNDWNWSCDLSRNGKIDSQDVAIVQNHYGQRDP